MSISTLISDTDNHIADGSAESVSHVEIISTKLPSAQELDIVEVPVPKVKQAFDADNTLQAISQVLLKNLPEETNNEISQHVLSVCSVMFKMAMRKDTTKLKKKVTVLAAKLEQQKSKTQQAVYQLNKANKRLRGWEDWRTGLLDSKKIKLLQSDQPQLMSNMSAAKIERQLILDLPKGDREYFVLQSPPCSLFTKSLKELCKTNGNGKESWLDDTIINTFFVIVAQEICMRFGMSYMVTLNSQYSLQLMGELEDYEDLDLTPKLAKAGYLAGKTKHLLIPVHLADCEHWVLLWVNFEKKHIVVYNTLKSIDFDYGVLSDNTLRALQLYHEDVYHTTLDINSWKTDVEIKYQQKGINSCGVHICILAKSIAFEEDIVWNSDQSSVNNYREFILGVFLYYCDRA